MNFLVVGFVNIIFLNRNEVWFKIIRKVFVLNLCMFLECSNYFIIVYICKEILIKYCLVYDDVVIKKYFSFYWFVFMLVSTF